jgi:hypothetical protein
MPRMLVLTIALLSSTVVPGCATTTYAPAPKGESGTSAVFIRQNAEPTARNLFVLIDGTKAARLSAPVPAPVAIQCTGTGTGNSVKYAIHATV